MNLPDKIDNNTIGTLRLHDITTNTNVATVAYKCNQLIDCVMEDRKNIEKLALMVQKVVHKYGDALVDITELLDEESEQKNGN